MKKNVFTILLLMFFSFFLNGQNLITNGNFEAGNNVGFQSDYNFINVGTGQSASIQGQYTIINNGLFLNTISFLNFGDHTTGSGLMMVCDGANTPGVFWKTNGNISLIGGITYKFKYWVRSANNTNPQAQIGFRVMQGTTSTYNAAYTVLPSAFGWQEVLYTFTVTGTGNQLRRLELFNILTSAAGNDFAMDDISLSPPLQISASSTPITCIQTNNGSISVYGISGLPPYTFQLTGPVNANNTTGIFNNLPSGTYNVSVTDSNAQTQIQNGVLVANSNMIIQASSPFICTGNSVTLTASGSSNVTWTANPTDASLTNPNNNSIIVSPTVSTTYTVTNNTPITSQNLITNGNFSAGNFGFNSDYDFILNNTTFNQKTYGIVTTANTWNPGFAPCTDHTGGGGNMMFVDGSTVNSGNDKVWCQMITVIPNTVYTFTYWTQSLSSISPARLETTINGAVIGNFTLPTATCSWQQITYTWNSGINTSAQICILDKNLNVTGNDFALDDISFTYVNTCSNTATFLLSHVITNVIPTFTPIPSICSGQVIAPLPTTSLNNITGTWSPAINNLTTTTYNFTPIAGQCASTTTLTINVNTLNAPTGAQTVCLDGDPAQICVTTDNTNTNGVSFVYFNTPQTANAVYTSGTLLDSVTPASGVACYNLSVLGTAGSLPNIVGTYYIYAILNPAPTNASCRPFQQIIINVIASYTVSPASTTPILCINTALTAITHTTTGATGIGTVAGLPAGVTAAWSNNTITITGTPSQIGVFNYSIPLTGGCSSINAIGTIIVTPNNTVTPASTTPTLCINTPLTTITHPTTGATGIGTAIGMPMGVTTVWNNNTITISGTPTQEGTYFYTIPLIGGCGIVNATGFITIAPLVNAGTILGNQNICIGATTIFSSTVTNGTWTSSDSNIASIQQNGTVTGNVLGTVTMTYTVLGTNGCANATATRTLTVHPIPGLPVVVTPFSYCHNDTSPINISSLVTGLAGSTIKYYTTATGGTGTVTALIPDTSILGIQNFYVSQTVNGCESGRVIVQINVLPVPIMTQVNPVKICSGESTSIVLRTSNNLSGVVYSWSATGVENVTSSLAQFSGTGITFVNPTLTLVPGINTPQTIIYTVTPEVGGLCKGEPLVFTVTVNPIPNITVTSGTVLIRCSGETTNITLSSLVQAATFTWVVVQPTFGVSGFSSNQTGNIINDVLTATGLSQGKVTYKVTPSFGGCNGLPELITVFVNPRPSEITYTPPTPVCSGASSTISINVFEANTLIKWTVEEFGVNNVPDNITGVIAPTSGSVPITDTLTLTENNAGYVIYTITPSLNGCDGTTKQVRVDVVPIPQPKLTDGVICIDRAIGNTYQNYILNSQLSSINHSFVWEFNGGTGNVFTIINNANGATYEASQVGTYRVKATNLLTGCVSNYATATITSSFPAQSMNVEVTNFFTENATIKVTVVGGTGQYMYQLGDGNLQNSNVFENVASGVHVVKVIDTQGCTYLTQEVTVIHYMQFFTPNGDGYNDTWKIKVLNQPDANIYIYDRTGKLLKQISGSENAQGWDGTYIGQPLPANDYWFTIEFKEKDINRTFKAHFTLKR